jgi:subtilisin family serine protease
LHNTGNWGAGVGVCVIDSAILVQNPDQASVISLNFASGTSSTETHGQYVMSLLSAPENNWGSVGICPASRLVLANVESSDNNMYVSSIVAALNYAASQSSIDIISVSLGTTENDPSLLLAINACYRAGKLIFAAAGNQGAYGIVYPAYYPGVISVGSTNSTGALSSFNTKNDAVSVFAPGENIRFVRAGDQTGTLFVSQSGTCFACPFAAGSAALILSAAKSSNSNARLSRAEIIQDLRSMFNLTCSIHSYTRPENPCISLNSGNPLAAEPMIIGPQAISTNTLSLTHRIIIISAAIILCVFFVYVFMSSSSTFPLQKSKVMAYI